MDDPLAKLDSPLRRIYTNYREVLAHGARGVDRIHPIVANRRPFYVYVHYTGSLEDIKAAGFESLVTDHEGVALGVMRLETLEQIAAHPAVLRLEIGSPDKAELDQSIPDVRASEVWTKVVPGNTFTGRTGAGVIVGIIDTGIDYRHVDFLQTSQDHQTRILRIWDMGLTPTGTEHGPDATLLSGGATYGVEYEEAQINADLASLAVDFDPIVRHLDCAGHGTHVASIAAGSGRARANPRTGVAPEAWIIAVRYLYLPADPVDTAGVQVNDSKRFKDAVRYVLNVASQRDGGTPVVLNMSFGSGLDPHDGTSERELWLAGEFPTTQTRRACVHAAGNENKPPGSHAEVDLPAGGGERRVPFKVVDLRGEMKRDWNSCTWMDNTVELEIEFWYVRGAASVQVAVKLPDLAANGSRTTKTSDFVPVGGRKHESFFGKKKFELVHEQALDVTLGSQILHRNRIHLTLTAEGNTHAEVSDVYELIIKSDAALHLEGWTDSGRRQFIQFGHFDASTLSHLPLPSGVTTPIQHQITNPAGARNTMAVAAYSAEPDPTPDPDPLAIPDGPRPNQHEIAEFSSRGGLVDYSGGGGLPLKPDLAAPGVEVDAAQSMGRGWLAYRGRLIRSAGYTQMDGTSMAAPHVTGTVALMLQARPSLTVAQISSILTDPNNLRPRPTDPDPSKDAALRLTYGVGLLDVKKIMDAVLALP